MGLLSHLARVLSDASLKRQILDAAGPRELAALLGGAP